MNDCSCDDECNQCAECDEEPLMSGESWYVTDFNDRCTENGRNAEQEWKWNDKCSGNAKHCATDQCCTCAWHSGNKWERLHESDEKWLFVGDRIYFSIGCVDRFDQNENNAPDNECIGDDERAPEQLFDKWIERDADDGCWNKCKNDFWNERAIVPDGRCEIPYRCEDCAALNANGKCFDKCTLFNTEELSREE